MNKHYFFLPVAILVLTAFNTMTNISYDDQQTSRDAVLAVLEKFHYSFGNRDTATLRTLIISPGIFCGTIPFEITDDKDFVLDYLMESYFGDTATVYSVTDREILVAADEKSAIAMEQFIYPPRSKRFYTRSNTHLVKIDGEWMIDSFCLSFVISDTDMAKINEILQ